MVVFVIARRQDHDSDTWVADLGPGSWVSLETRPLLGEDPLGCDWGHWRSIQHERFHLAKHSG